MRLATYLLLMVLLVAHPSLVCAMSRPAAAFSPDGNRTVVSGKDGALILWDIATKTKIATLYEPWRIPCSSMTQRCLLNFSVGSFSPDGRLLATWRSGRHIILRNPRNGRKRSSLTGTSLRGHHEPLRLTFSPDSRSLVAVTRKHAGKRHNTDFVEVWDFYTGTELLHLRSSPRREFKQVALSPDGKTLMAVEGWPHGVTVMGPEVNRLVKLWAIERGEELVTLKGHSAAFSPDGNFLIVTNPGNPDTLWDIRKGKTHLMNKGGKIVRQRPK